MRDVNSIRDELVTMIGESVRFEFTHCPSILGHDSDVIEALAYLLPSADAFTADDYDGDEDAAAVAWVEDAAGDLDLDGYAAREACEELFDGLVSRSDCNEFYAGYSGYCDDAVDEMGGFAKVAYGCESVQDIIYKAAPYGAYAMWRGYVSNALDRVRCDVERLADEVGAQV